MGRARRPAPRRPCTASPGAGPAAGSSAAAAPIRAYRPDTSAPTTTASGLQVDDHSGWTNAATNVTLSATDAGSAGVAATFYTVDGGGQRRLLRPILRVRAGPPHRHLLVGRRVAANAEAAKTGYVNIDTTPPTVGSDADAAWHSDRRHRAPERDGQRRERRGGDAVPRRRDGRLDDRGRQQLRRGGHQRPGRARVRRPSPWTGPATPASPARAPCRIDATPPVTTADRPRRRQDLRSGRRRQSAVSLSCRRRPRQRRRRHPLHDGRRRRADVHEGVHRSGAGTQHPVTYWSVDKNGNVEAHPHRLGQHLRPLRPGGRPASGPRFPVAQRGRDRHHHLARHRRHPTIVYTLDGQDPQERRQPRDVRGLRRRSPRGGLLGQAANAREPSDADRLRQHRHAVAPTTTTQVSAPRGWINHGVTLRVP